MINHGHIKVNKKRVNISSYLVKDTDLIEIREKSKIVIRELQIKKEKFKYIQLDKKKTAKLVRFKIFRMYPVIMEKFNIEYIPDNWLVYLKRKILYNLKKINVDKDNVNFTSLDDLHFYGSDKANDFKKKILKDMGFKFYSHHLKILKQKNKYFRNRFLCRCISSVFQNILKMLWYFVLTLTSQILFIRLKIFMFFGIDVN